MNTKARISSILNGNGLDHSITGIPSFNLSDLNVLTDIEFTLPSNLRLGHLAEKIVSALIKASTNYEILYENVQLIEDKRTIGEIDFIIQDKKSEQLIHLEFAYKFYLFDPQLSTEAINNWIGPNRNDSLKEKLEKLRKKQFPLLYHPCAKSEFNAIPIDEVSQSLCLLVSLFVPYEFKESLSPVYERAIRGYYLNFDAFSSLDNSEKTYYLPSKKEWGMDPSENETWADFEGVEKQISVNMKEKQAPLCWQKAGEAYSTFFIVWW